MLKQSLANRCPLHFEVPLLLLTAAGLLGVGLFLPTLTLKELVFWKHTFSILTGIQNLYQEKHYTLAGIIFLFSIVFPIAKLGSLTLIWYVQFTEESRSKMLRWLDLFGKWSMLDVLVVAITIVITKLSGLVKAEPHIGIYLFAGSVILSMLTTMYIEYLGKRFTSSP